ncbi:MAG: P-II family nitrogen regulator [Nitrospirota bacterium]|nr:P-II family nitrogen regulator [Nitrospirota bacterium]
MKEIKAYIQQSPLNNTVDKLERAGAPEITVVEIHPVGYGYEPNYFGFQSEDAFKRYSHLRLVRLEVVCADQDWERLAKVIEDTCRTGAKGDGRIFVTDVAAPVRIRDGLRGGEAL